MIVVKVYGERGHNPEWEGRLSDFLRANRDDAGMVDAVRGAWNSREYGHDAAFDLAAPAQTLRLVTLGRR